MNLKELIYNSKFANYYRFIRLKLSRIKRPKFNDAYIYCQGNGIEIGALSVPYKFQKSTLKYADIKTAEEIVSKAAQDEICEIANDNSSGQIVISGNIAAINRAINLGKEFSISKNALIEFLI